MISVFDSAVMVGFDPTMYTVLEGEPAVLTLVKVGDTEGPVVVTVTTSDNTAEGSCVGYWRIFCIIVGFSLQLVRIMSH